MNGEGVLLTIGRWRAADFAGGDETVLTAQLVDHIGGREVVGSKFLRVEPQPEGNLAVAEIGDITDALDPFDVVGEVLVEISTDRLHRVLGRGGIFVDEVVNEQDRIGGLVDRHTGLAHLFRQLRFRKGDPVLHIHLIDVAVGAAVKGHGNRTHTIG